jgi:hypothetical protein
MWRRGLQRGTGFALPRAFVGAQHAVPGANAWQLRCDTLFAGLRVGSY